jgi:tripartite-type tricarboxylate transporter receptor subunit TctC
MVHVPFSGGAPGLAALVGGQVQLMADNMNSALPMIKAGKVRAIAVTTARRSVALPEMATIAEQALPGFDSGSWFGLFAPAGTPSTIVTRLNTEVVRMLQQADVRERMLQQGAEPAPNSPAEFTALIRNDIARWAKVIQVSGTKAD